MFYMIRFYVDKSYDTLLCFTFVKILYIVIVCVI